MHPIRLILFDLGSVVVRIDIPTTVEYWSEKTGVPAAEIEKKINLDHTFKLFEQGLIPPEDYRKYLMGQLGIELSPEDFYEGWNRMILGTYPETVELISKLRKHYRVAAFSNSNILHEEYLRKQFPALDLIFEKIYFSHRINLRKPIPEAFFKVLEQARVDAGECVFLDDLSENIDAAKSVGFHTILVTQQSDILSGLKALGVRYE